MYAESPLKIPKKNATWHKPIHKIILQHWHEQPFLWVSCAQAGKLLLWWALQKWKSSGKNNLALPLLFQMGLFSLIDLFKYLQISLFLCFSFSVWLICLFVCICSCFSVLLTAVSSFSRFQCHFKQMTVPKRAWGEYVILASKEQRMTSREARSRKN